ncbi:rhodanese-like domain-containing protein [Stieleria sp. ICT_E10.1]|uniref:rhodanese-like domain-containing protein n=1 Tax=Stieleria sedimenti TaxID=2976331 RepID=UPI0021806D42|nr:rhodanese-like domain-containing protein [Stieleria sedimenti]MCS7465308.1 rhodanese-like domain-containing protein [Stieleria sedimenti]
MSSDYPIEIDVQTVNALQDSDESFLLLDVRQNEEYATAKIDGSVLIPMGELGQRLDELDPYKNQRIVVHCHHGGRSMQVTEALRSRGFDKAQNMAGGIDAWSLQIDSSVPRY